MTTTQSGGNGRMDQHSSRRIRRRQRYKNDRLWLCVWLVVLYSSSAIAQCHALLGYSRQGCQDPCIAGDESIMAEKEHGTSDIPVQEKLRWGCDRKIANRICNYNRHYSEYAGYWELTSFTEELKRSSTHPITFYDSNTGKPLFTGPTDRSWDTFIKDAQSNGWPVFRDQDVHWENVRVLSDKELVSLDGTHLGEMLPPDSTGRRYSVNLVSIAGYPADRNQSFV